MTTLSSEPSVPLSTLFSRALKRASQCADLPTVDDKTQQEIRAALEEIKQLTLSIRSLGIFSPNETVEDISTRNLVYLLSPFIEAQLQNKVATSSPRERLSCLKINQSLLQAFASTLTHYEIVPSHERELLEGSTLSVGDPVKRREQKIKQYKKEKELRNEIETLRKRRLQALTSIKNDFDLIASLLPSNPGSSEREEEDDGIEDLLRSITLILLRLFFVQTQSQLESLQQEVELLRTMPDRPPSPPQRDAREVTRNVEEDRWRLDKPLPAGGPDGMGPLLDSSGRPLRPFTILPAGESANRVRLQAEVFRPDHRLPTMSIDEYLEIERERGNIITGGGPQSEEQLTSSEQLELDSEMDGSTFAQARAEEKRLKEEQWAVFTELNPRGSGNTMNRG